MRHLDRWGMGGRIGMRVGSQGWLGQGGREGWRKLLDPAFTCDTLSGQEGQDPKYKGAAIELEMQWVPLDSHPIPDPRALFEVPTPLAT